MAATERTTLTTEWQQVATGAALVQIFSGDNVLINVGDDTPAADAPALVLRRANFAAFSYTGTLNVYARSEQAASVTTVADGNEA